jgi:hypothetical protein
MDQEEKPKLSLKEQGKLGLWKHFDQLHAKKASFILENHLTLSVRDMRFACEELARLDKLRNKLRAKVLKNSGMTWEELLKT